MFIIVLGLHVSILIESFYQECKRWGSHDTFFKILTKDLFS